MTTTQQPSASALNEATLEWIEQRHVCDDPTLPVDEQQCRWCGWPSTWPCMTVMLTRALRAARAEADAERRGREALEYIATLAAALWTTGDTNPERERIIEGYLFDALEAAGYTADVSWEDVVVAHTLACMDDDAAAEGNAA